MKKSIWISTALAAAAMAVAGPAAAVSSATATITGFSFVLYDLDPSDGIDPELTFTYEQSSSSAYVYSSAESADDSDWQPGNFVPTSATALLAFGNASAATDASSATASGSVSGPGYGGEGYFSANAYGVDNGFTLTPWTGVKLTATSEGTASTGPSSGSSGNDYASAYGQLQTTIYGDNGYEYHSSSRQAYASCGTWDGIACSGESNSFSGTFSVSYANFSDDAVAGYISAYASAYGRSTVPVPEPQTYLMLLAGLAGVSAVVRRRRTA
jgi:hypothetical protein